MLVHLNQNTILNTGVSKSLSKKKEPQIFLGGSYSYFSGIWSFKQRIAVEAFQCSNSYLIVNTISALIRVFIPKYICFLFFIIFSVSLLPLASCKYKARVTLCHTVPIYRLSLSLSFNYCAGQWDN